MGSFAIGLILSRSWLGNLVDRRSRKLVVLFGTIVAATAPLGYLFFAIFPLYSPSAPTMASVSLLLPLVTVP
jgi:MFS family permease